MDFDALRQDLSDHVIEGPKERYQFTWPDKSKARVLANTPTTMTLRPCREDSVDFDNTKNIYIEGDNLEVLKILRETYLGKVKMIYIDPPYNTGNDFVYDDDFSMSSNEYSERSGQVDETGNRMFVNTTSNGRFHTDWLNMIYPRLLLAKDFLTEDGVIFISIDENEYSNLVNVCDEVFGSGNKIDTIIWERAFAPKNDAKYISSSHDYVVVYTKNINSFQIGKLPRTEEANARYKNPDNDSRGPWTSGDLTVKTYSKEYDYKITTPSGNTIKPTAGRCWFTNKKRMEELIADNRIWFGEDGNNMPRLKRFLSDVQDGMVPTSIWKFEEVGHNQEGRQELKKIFSGKGYFDGPKPTRLILKILKIANLKDDSIVMDFFSGSATTADAILKYNLETGKKIRYVLVQLPEKCPIDSQAFEDGYQTICDLGIKRIDLIGKTIKNNIDDSIIDVGFRVFKLDTSNMINPFYNTESIKQMEIDAYTDSIKSDRSPKDLLIQSMLELGIEISAKIESDSIDGIPVSIVNDGYLVACLSDSCSESVITALARREMKPAYAVIRNGSGMTDPMLSNIEQIFKTYSPETIVRFI
ncbi:site-specific DNA-methyltransferase [Methanomassiliicoccaceae archaeon COG_1]|nr:site-specific DNA-methyltransferase [Methanomassiliicoccaceae archaeon COG_1]